MPTDATFEIFRLTRSLCSQLVHTRLDLAFLVNKAAQTTPCTFSSDNIRELNEGISKVKLRSKKGLSCSHLSLRTVSLRVYNDASYASSDDLTSHVVHTFLLAVDDDHCHVLDYSSRMSRLVVRSFMSGKTCSFLDVLTLPLPSLLSLI